jgi:AcrR family transcriptional regulator
MMEAVRDLVREAPDDLTMQAIAARAEVGSATAYRYYSGVDEILATYTLRVVEELRSFSEASTAEGRDRFDAVLTMWTELLDRHGPVMVRLRSHRGFLERLGASDPIIATWVAAWTEPVTALLADCGLPREQLRDALFLCNIVFDPREIGDLRTESDLSLDVIRARLTSAYLGALRGWNEVPAG